MKNLPFIAITIAGFIGSIGQILIVRELLVIFYGNELTAGVILTVWMLWIAAGSMIGGKIVRWFSKQTLECALMGLAVLLPASVLWIRSARVIRKIPIGELLSPELILSISVSATAPFCFLFGMIFSLAWSLHSVSGDTRHPIIVYLGESVGAAIGGMAVYLIFLPMTSPFYSSLIAAAGAIGVLSFSVKPWDLIKTKSFSSIFWICSAVSVVCGFWASTDLDRISHRWQLGKNVVAVRDSPYNHLAIAKHLNQLTVFANSIWLFSTPDPQHSESMIHPILLQHPNPQKILLIGSAGIDPVYEILKHDVTRLDIIESDPYLFPFISEYLPETKKVLADERITVINKDARLFIRTTDRMYDVIIMSIGDPMNAQMNRFYTDKFFELVHRRLNADGIFAFSVSSSPNMLGQSQILYLQSFYETLRHVFTQILIYPGESVRFLAASRKALLTRQPDDLIRRKNSRNLELKYVHDNYFVELLNPFQMDYLNEILKKTPSDSDPRINQDFSPTCYYYSLVLWGSQVHSGMKKYLALLAKIPPFLFWSGIGGIVLIGLLIWMIVQPGLKVGVAVCVTITGCALIVEEIILILGFQVLMGYIYQELCLIISVFMSGLAIGAGASRYLRFFHRVKLLFIIQTIIGCHLVVTMGIIYIIQSVGISAPVSLIFSVSAATAGILGGLHFSSAVNAFSDQSLPSATTGGCLYALDLLGGASGAILISLIIIPVYGLTPAILSVALLTFAGSIALIL